MPVRPSPSSTRLRQWRRRMALPTGVANQPAAPAVLAGALCRGERGGAPTPGSIPPTAKGALTGLSLGTAASAVVGSEGHGGQRPAAGLERDARRASAGSHEHWRGGLAGGPTAC